MAICMVYYYLLLAHWLSAWYTTHSYLPTRYLYGTLLSSNGPLTIPMLHYTPLLANCFPYATLISSTGPLPILMVHYPLTLAHWISLWYKPIFYWPTGYLYGTQPSPICPLAIPMVHYYLLLAQWLSQW